MSITSSSPVLSVCFLFAALLIGTSVLYVSSRCHNFLPYTVSIFVVGIVIAIVSDQILNSNNDLINGAEQFENINPDVLLGAFLPALLFGEAMHLNFYQVKQAFPSAALLAIPGAAFGAYMLALLCCYALPNVIQWDWRLCFIMGSILSATDPVSVIATLKGLSSSSPSTIKLTYIIVGEALLNDGMAIVLFGALTTPAYSTANDIVIYFIRVLFISPLVGIALGIGCILILRVSDRKVSHDDKTIQVSATVGCAYVSFFLAQYVLNVSGVISCVCSGVVIAWLGPPLVLQPTSMETIWEFLEWIGNTLIFMIAGLIVGKYVIYYSQPIEYALIVVIYIYIMVIRLVLLLICYPMVRKMSEGYTMNDVYFSTFAGLRGAVSLALCIVILSHSDADITNGEIIGDQILFPKIQIRQVVFFVCGVVALTILINGSLSRFFFEYLYSKIDEKTTEADSVILHYVRKRIWMRTEDVLYQLEEILPDHSPLLVRKICKDLLPESNESERKEENDSNLDSIFNITGMLKCGSGRGKEQDGDDDYDAYEEEKEAEQGQGHDVREKNRGNDSFKSNRSRSRARRDTSLDIDGDIDDYRERRIGGYGTVTDKYRNTGSEKETAGKYKSNNNQGKSMDVDDKWFKKDEGSSYDMDSDKDVEKVMMSRFDRDIISSDSDDVIKINQTVERNQRKYMKDIKNENPVDDDSSDLESNVIKDFYGSQFKKDSLNNEISSSGLQNKLQIKDPAQIPIERGKNGRRKGTDETRKTPHTARFIDSTVNSPSVISPYSSSDLRGSLTSIVNRKMAVNLYKNSIPRPLESNVDHFLITKFRTLFLGVLRFNYMKQIKCGRLPRESRAALILLNSIDVGMATVHTAGLQDWDAVKACLSRTFPKGDLKTAPCSSSISTVLSSVCGVSASNLWVLSAEDKVYILTGFMDAHRCAEEAIPLYLGEQEGISTPEEALVVKESESAVKEAELCIHGMDSAVLTRCVSKQAVLMVLRSVDDLTELFVEEGILNARAAHVFFDHTRSARMSLPTVLEKEFQLMSGSDSSIV